MVDDKPSLPDSSHVRTLDAGALRALAHPIRVQIYDILSQYGPQTASSLAEMTGESSGSTSYHLRALAKHDLIREVEGRGTARERWWERPVGGVSFTNPEAARTPAGRAASQVVMSEFLGRRHSQLMRFVGTSLDDELDAWAQHSLIATSSLRLTADQLAEVSKRVQAVIDELVDEYRVRDEDVPDDARTVSLRADVFPLPLEGN